MTGYGVTSCLENGSPLVPDTFGRLFGLIDPKNLEAASPSLGRRASSNSGQDAVVAIDGKTSRRTGKLNATPLHLVRPCALDSFWDSATRKIERENGHS